MPRIGWRQWLLPALFVLLTIWVVTRFANFEDLTATLAGARVIWLLIALVIHLAYFAMYAQLYVLAFGIVGVASNVLQIVPVQFGALFINGVAPSAGTAGAALFIDDANRRGESGARAAIGTVLVLLLDLSTLVPFLVFGIAFLAVQGALALYDWITSLFYVIFVSLLSTAIALARHRPSLLRAVLVWIRGVANHVGAWVRRPNLLGERWAEDNADELNAAAVAVRDHPRRLTIAVAWAVVMHAVNAAGLYAIFVGLHQQARPGVVVAGFSLGIVFWVVAVIPEGAGAVEGVMALVFSSLGVPKSTTAAIVLVYRAYNYYLPILVGFFLLQRSRLFRGDGDRGGKGSGRKGSEPDSAPRRRDLAMWPAAATQTHDPRVNGHGAFVRHRVEGFAALGHEVLLFLPSGVGRSERTRCSDMELLEVRALPPLPRRLRNHRSRPARRQSASAVSPRGRARPRPLSAVPHRGEVGREARVAAGRHQRLSSFQHDR